MSTLHERNQVLLTVPLAKDVRAWLRRESKRRRVPQGQIIERILRMQMDFGRDVADLFSSKGRLL